MVKKIDPDSSAEFEQGLDQIKQALGMDLQADILETLGDEWAVYSDPNVGGSGALGITLVNHLKDGAKADRAFGQLEQLLNGIIKQEMAGEKMTVAFHTSKQGDLTIHYLGIPVVAPSWAIKDGNLYVGLYPQVVSGAAEHVAGKGPSILENEGFAAMRKRLGGENISAISFTDLPRTAAEGYQEILMLSRVWLGMADLFGAKTPALVMPTLNKLMPHVTPAAAVAYVDKAGWHLKQITPFPGSEILSAGGLGSIMAAQQATVVGVALPALGKARMSANRVKSASNLRQVGQAMMMYANENKGKFPATPGELLLTQDITVDVFVNPEAGTVAPPPGTNKDELAQWVNKNSDYVYLGAGRKDPAGADTILAHDKLRPNTFGINLLFGDGHVEFVATPRAQELIARQKLQDVPKGQQQ
jgi:prepilin-type processing-associated H-X9-DG protein